MGVKPNTDINTVVDWVDQDLVDMVLVMTVEPGFGGQSFMQDSVKMLWQYLFFKAAYFLYLNLFESQF